MTMTDKTPNTLPELSNPTRRQWFKHAARTGGVVALATSAMLVTGCGQKGPLYIPGDGKKKKKKT